MEFKLDMDNLELFTKEEIARRSKLAVQQQLNSMFNDSFMLHREDGPAVEYANGDKVWYVNGKQHREDGPAVEEVNGDKEWYIDGEKLTEEEFNKLKGK